MASGSDISIFRLNFSLLFSYVSPAASRPAVKSRNKHPCSDTPSTDLSAIDEYGNEGIASDTSEASLSPVTRDMQRQIRMQYHRRLERLTEGQSSQCLRPSTNIRLEEGVQTDRQSLEALEAATTVYMMTQKIERLHSDAHTSLSPSPNSAQQAPHPPSRLRAGKLYSGTSPWNTLSSPTTGGTSFNIRSLPSELPSDPTDSDLFRLEHDKLFMLDAPEEVVQQSADALVQDWLADRMRPRAPGSDSHQSLFKEVMELAAEELEASVASEALVDSPKPNGMDLIAYEEEVIRRGGERGEGEGHSADSWSDDGPPAVLASVEEAMKSVMDDECEWLDLGPMVSAQ